MNPLQNNIGKHSLFFKKTRIQKLKQSPIKMLYPEILKMISLISKKPFKIYAKTFWDENMLLVVPELISLCILRYGFYEEGLTRMILEYLKAGMTFLDVGAHFGYFSLLASAIVGDSGQVHSFEPTPSSFNILRANSSSRNNIVINNYGIFSKKIDISLNDLGLRYSSFNSIFNPRLSSDVLEGLSIKTYAIKCVSIDEYVEEKSILPNFIKIDAESSEYEIILGMERTIKKCHPLISIEVGDMGIENIAKSSEVIELLVNKNYKPYIYNSSIIINYDKMDISCKYDNMLFVPS